MKKRTYLIFIIISSVFTLAAGTTVLVLVLFFPNSFNGAFKNTREQNIYKESINFNHTKTILSVSFETIHHSRTADAVKGYWVKLLDPTNEKPIDQLFIKRSLDLIPEKETEVFVTADNQIWLIEKSERNVLVDYDSDRSNNFEGFAALIKVVNGKLEKQNISFLNGWTIIETQKNNAVLRNLFDQEGCLDYATHAISATKCSTE